LDGSDVGCGNLTSRILAALIEEEVISPFNTQVVGDNVEDMQGFEV
jgi:hypothetical protein